jgi:Uma2 family endonuclease
LELVEGEIVEKMPSFTPSQIAGIILTYINLFLFQNPIGYVTGADGSYTIDEENDYIPDVGYISKERLPERPARGVSIPPDLAVEVVSPTDSIKKVQRKAKKYLRFGTKMVWIVYPEDQTVDVCLPDPDMPDGMRVHEVGMDGMLDGDAVLPGFKLAVKDIFPQ